MPSQSDRLLMCFHWLPLGVPLAAEVEASYLLCMSQYEDMKIHMNISVQLGSFRVSVNLCVCSGRVSPPPPRVTTAIRSRQERRS